MTITFYTGNAGKFAELRAAYPGKMVQDAGGYPEIQADSLEEVARAGASWLAERGACAPFLLEDAGLFVPELRGFPGVYSRYAYDTLGPERIARLAKGMDAHFEAQLLYAEPAQPSPGGPPPNPTIHLFSGRVRGTIVDPRGSGGFGFDPIFMPRGHDRTFAEMGREEKERLSHRGKALRQWIRHLDRVPLSLREVAPGPSGSPPRKTAKT